MLFECEFCGEHGMQLNEAKQSLRWLPDKDGNPTTEDIIDMKCIKCGVHEPCESDDLIGFMMEILGEKNYKKAMLKTLRILWKDTHLQEMVE